MDDNRKTKELDFQDEITSNIKDINFDSDLDSKDVKNNDDIEQNVKNNDDIEKINNDNNIEDDYLNENNQDKPEIKIENSNENSDNDNELDEDSNEDVNKEKNNNSLFSTGENEIPNSKDEDKKSGYLKDNSAEKKQKQKKIIKISIIVLIVLIVLTGIIVGSLAIAGVFDNEKDNIGGDQNDAINNWASHQVEENTKIENTINILSDRAILYYYDSLGKNGKLTINDYQGTKEKVQKDAEKQVNNEQSDMKNNEGKNWEEEWDKNLVQKGFSTAKNGGTDQYIDSIVSEQLKGYITDAFTGGGKITESTILTTNVEGHKYTSSDNGNGSYYVLPNASDVANNSSYVDIQSLFDFYASFKKPFVYDEILIPFTISNFDQTHFFVTPPVDGKSQKEIVENTVTFSDVNSIGKLWTILTNMSNGEFEFDDPSYQKTNSGIQHLSYIETITSSSSETDTSGTEGSDGTTTTYDSNNQTKDETTDGSTDETTDSSTEGLDENGFNEMELAIIHSLLMFQDNASITSNEDLNQKALNIMDLIQSDFGTIDINGIQNWNTQTQESFSAIFNNVMFNNVILTPSNVYSINEDDEDYYLIFSLQNDGIHLMKFDGVEYGNGFIYDDQYMAESMYKNDIDITTNIGDYNNTDEVYDVWEDFRDFVSENIELILLNEAYENNINLNVNEEYGWEDVIVENLDGETVEDNQLIIEEYIYGRPALGLFINYSQIRNSYMDYSDEFEWETPKVIGNGLPLADLTVGGEQYDLLRNLVIYSGTDFTYGDNLTDEDLLKNWNFFRINYSEDDQGKTEDDSFGAINIFNNESEII